MSYYALNNYNQAAAYLQRSINSELVTGDVLWALAVAYDKIGSKELSLNALVTLMNRFPGYNVQTYIAVGMAYLNDQKNEAALNVFRQGLNYFQNNADLLYWVGHTYYLSGNYEAAIPYLEKSNALLPNNIDTLYDLGGSYLIYERLNEASTCADVMARIDPNNAKTKDLYQAVQQKIMQKQMEQQMQIDMINQQTQETLNMPTAIGMDGSLPVGVS